MIVRKVVVPAACHFGISCEPTTTTAGFRNIAVPSVEERDDNKQSCNPAGLAGLRSLDEELTMRKWLVPLAVLGAGGLGAFLLSEKGRVTLQRWLAALDQSPGRWEEWNEAAQSELDGIQASLDQIAQSLEPHGEPGH